MQKALYTLRYGDIVWVVLGSIKNFVSKLKLGLENCRWRSWVKKKLILDGDSSLPNATSSA